MTKKSVEGFRSSCRTYLLHLSLDQLRAYARHVGVQKPTTQSKATLVSHILDVLTGKTAPKEQSMRGAPVKNQLVDFRIIEEVGKLQVRYLCETREEARRIEGKIDTEARFLAMESRRHEFALEDPTVVIRDEDGSRHIFVGQLETLNNVSMLIPLSCKDSDEKPIVSDDLIVDAQIENGDVVTCYAERRNHLLFATDILTVNELVLDGFQRKKFDESNVCYPRDRLVFFDRGEAMPLTAKCLQWLIPMGKGQRGCVVSAPKAGKTSVLLEVARALQARRSWLTVLVLLVDQSPETVAQFRAYTNADNFVYSTYDDDPDRQIFTAEFLLKRAKRYAECGHDVLLLVDSLTALAHAYNELPESAGGKVLAGGLESKTLQYVKKFFGSARCLEGGGSLSILGTVSKNTGNPMDDLLHAELSAVSNLEVALSEELARQRIYPAIDFANTQKRNGLSLEGDDVLLDLYIRNEYIPKYGAQRLFSLMKQSASYDEFMDKLKQE